MSYNHILPFFPEELRALLLDTSISDLMINGTRGVYADRNGVVEHVPLREPYTNERLLAAIVRVARVLGQDLTPQNPILNTRLPDGSRVAVVGAPSSINGPTLTIRKFNRWFSSDELVESGGLPADVRDRVVAMIADRKNGMIAGGTGSGKSGTLATLEGQKFPKQTFVADGSKVLDPAAPLVVLVNRGTSGPAEIVAGAILDNKRGELVGEKTFGEGSVQKTFELPDGGAVILSIAKYASPSGKQFEDDAVTPGTLVASSVTTAQEEQEEDEDASPAETTPAPVVTSKPAAAPVDDQLNKALEILKAKNA